MWLVPPLTTVKRSPEVKSPQQAQHLGAQLLCRYLAVFQLGLDDPLTAAGPALAAALEALPPSTDQPCTSTAQFVRAQWWLPGSQAADM